MKIWTKEEVLSRSELTLEELKSLAHFRLEEGWPHNQFWDGGKCYVPVIYKGRAFKVIQRIKVRET